MSVIALLLLSFAVLPAFALAAMGWLALATEASDLRSLNGLEGRHFESP